jgi:hypothetical protein
MLEELFSLITTFMFALIPLLYILSVRSERKRRERVARQNRQRAENRRMDSLQRETEEVLPEELGDPSSGYRSSGNDSGDPAGQKSPTPEEHPEETGEESSLIRLLRALLTRNEQERVPRDTGRRYERSDHPRYEEESEDPGTRGKEKTEKKTRRKRREEHPGQTPAQAAEYHPDTSRSREAGSLSAEADQWTDIWDSPDASVAYSSDSSSVLRPPPSSSRSSNTLHWIAGRPRWQQAVLYTEILGLPRGVQEPRVHNWDSQ